LYGKTFFIFRKTLVFGSQTVTVVCALRVDQNDRGIRGRIGRRWAFNEVLI